MPDVDSWQAHQREHDLLEKLADVKNDSHQSEHSIRLAAHLREHELQGIAIGKAEMAMDRRLEGMNDLRAQLDRQAGTFVTREAYDAQGDRFDAVLRGLATKHDADIEAQRTSIQGEREIRKSFEASVNTWKWIAGFLGASGVGGVILLLISRAQP